MTDDRPQRQLDLLSEIFKNTKVPTSTCIDYLLGEMQVMIRSHNAADMKAEIVYLINHAKEIRNMMVFQGR